MLSDTNFRHIFFKQIKEAARSVMKTGAEGQNMNTITLSSIASIQLFQILSPLIISK